MVVVLLWCYCVISGCGNVKVFVVMTNVIVMMFVVIVLVVIVMVAMVVVQK